MTGLALGAGLLGQWLSRSRYPNLSLVILMILVAASVSFIPHIVLGLSGVDTFWQEIYYLILSAAAGLLTGTGFPLAVHQAHVDTNEVLRTSGIAEAADDFGGALGGLLTGALLVPILGVTGTSYLLALFSLIAVLPLLYAHFTPARLPALQARGYRSFPWTRLSWILAFFVISTGIITFMARGTAPGPVVKFNETLLGEISNSQEFKFRSVPVPRYLGGGSETEANETPDTVSLASMAVTSDVRGYAGPLNLLVSVDAEGSLRGVHYVDSNETPAYIDQIENWLEGLAGRDLSQSSLSIENYDALTGATVSSRAALESINQTVKAGGKMGFDKTFGDEIERATFPWHDTGFILTLLLFLGFFPVYFSGKERLRLGYQLAVLVVLGFYLNTLFTEIDLINITQGHVSSWSSNPQRWLILGFVTLTALLFGQAWCGYVCPFGALQEIFSRLGRLLYMRSYVEQELERRIRYLKYVILALMLVIVWISGNSLWASFDPMQHFFAGHMTGWIGAITLISLIGSLFYVRFWCRYFCPVGAFLSLFNKLALFDRLTPDRRFEHCDLGVRNKFDVDCIRCHRCLRGKDYGIRHKPSKAESKQ